MKFIADRMYKYKLDHSRLSNYYQRLLLIKFMTQVFTFFFCLHNYFLESRDKKISVQFNFKLWKCNQNPEISIFVGNMYMTKASRSIRQINLYYQPSAHLPPRSSTCVLMD